MPVSWSDFDDSVMKSLFPNAWEQKANPASIPIKKKTDRKTIATATQPEVSEPELFPLQERPEVKTVKTAVLGSEDKPAGVKPIAGAKSTKKPSSPFDFAKEHEAYEERRNKGNQEMQRILSALTDERARDYVQLYFASASVMWNVEKFRKRIRESIAFWESNRAKYGDGKLTNYTRSIETALAVMAGLDTLDAMD